LVVTRRTSGVLEDETGYVSRSGGHLEVIWLLPEGYLEFWRMKMVMCPALNVFWRLFGCYQKAIWRMKLVMCPDLEVTWRLSDGYWKDFWRLKLVMRPDLEVIWRLFIG